MKINYIKNQRLTIEIPSPGTTYSGSRFDWTGFITQITLDGKHTFCVPEQYDPSKGSGGKGFCNEFGIDCPIHYDQTNIGDCFPKIGVGLLTKKNNEAYDFFSPHKIQPISFIEELIDQTTYKVTSTIAYDKYYNLKLNKTIKVDDNHLLIDYSLENLGTIDVITNEYCHNFIGIDQTNIGPDYTLRFPGATTIEKVVGTIEINGDSLTWPIIPESDFYCLLELSVEKRDYHWQLTHIPSQISVRDYTQIPISKCALWGSTHVVSPELFIAIALKPNESMSWQRHYGFFAPQDL